MKRLLFIVFFVPLISFAQNKPILVEGVYPNLYVNHTVVTKENYYSIGRLYNISPKEIAPFNQLELAKGLTLNQVIKIPLTALNFSQINNAAADEAMIPLYHTVKEKEGLYRIGSDYNQLPVATLKQWNNIKGDAVSNGTKLIIGYLKVKTALSAFAGQAKPMVPVASTVTVPAKEISKPDIANETLPPAKNPAKDKTVAPVTVQQKPTVTAPVKEKEQQTVVTEPVKKVPPSVVKESVPVKNNGSATTGRSFNKAYFKPDFDKQTQQTTITTENGTAAIFKSTSGWDDGKYYCLHNTAAPGTIIKITSPATGKYIYAKVLDVIPDMKQNNDLLIRLSNAAAAELGVGENKFVCMLGFSK